MGPHGPFLSIARSECKELAPQHVGPGKPAKKFQGLNRPAQNIQILQQESDLWSFVFFLCSWASMLRSKLLAFGPGYRKKGPVRAHSELSSFYL